MKITLLSSLLSRTWIDVTNYENSTTRYFCSGVVQDASGMVYYVLHIDPAITGPSKQGATEQSRPYLIPVEAVASIRFAPPAPAPTTEQLFNNDMPFYIGEKSGGVVYKFPKSGKKRARGKLNAKD